MFVFLFDDFIGLLRSDTTERSVRNQATVYTKHDIPQGTDGTHDFPLLHFTQRYRWHPFWATQSVATMFAGPFLCVSAMVVYNEVAAITSYADLQFVGLRWAIH